MNKSTSTTEPSATSEPTATEPAQENDAPSAPLPAIMRSLAERTWWLPWLLGVAVIVVGIALVIQYLDDSPASVPEQRKQALPHSDHTVVYEVTGSGKSPEIRFVSSGQGDADRVLGVALPWRKKFSVSVGPTAGIVQVLASNSGESNTIACSIRVDGQVANHQTATGAFSSVSCSAAINP